MKHPDVKHPPSILDLVREQFDSLLAMRREHEKSPAGCICADCQRWGRIAVELYTPWAYRWYSVPHDIKFRLKVRSDLSGGRYGE